MVKADYRKQESAFLYSRIQELEDHINKYEIRVEELEAGERQEAQDQQLLETTEYLSDQTHEDGEILDVISQNDSVLSEQRPLDVLVTSLTTK
jgi:hypothetical protein